jgi:hypothetical protein
MDSVAAGVLYSVCVGNQTGRVQTAGYNTLIGYRAGTALLGGLENVCIGYLSGAKLTTGGFNVLVGSGAGEDVTTSAELVLI